MPVLVQFGNGHSKMKAETLRSFPDRKISETLIDFAEPIVAMIDGHTYEEDIRMGFKLAITVWNALVFDAVQGSQKYLNMLRQNLGDQLHSEPLIQGLIRRKRERFPEDLRAIGDHKITYQDGELRVWAEARDPFTCKTDQD